MYDIGFWRESQPEGEQLQGTDQELDRQVEAGRGPCRIRREVCTKAPEGGQILFEVVGCNWKILDQSRLLLCNLGNNIRSKQIFIVHLLYKLGKDFFC